MPGGPTPDTSHRRRIERLERQVEELLAQRDQLRLEAVSPPRDHMLAITTAQGNDPYPTSGAVLPVTFLDAYWITGVGSVGFTQNPRAEDYQVVAQSITGRYALEGVVVKVRRQRGFSATQLVESPSFVGEWWIEEQPEFVWVEFGSDGLLNPQAGSTSTGVVNPMSYDSGVGRYVADDTVQISVKNGGDLAAGFPGDQMLCRFNSVGTIEPVGEFGLRRKCTITSISAPSVTVELFDSESSLGATIGVDPKNDLQTGRIGFVEYFPLVREWWLTSVKPPS